MQNYWPILTFPKYIYPRATVNTDPLAVATMLMALSFRNDDEPNFWLMLHRYTIQQYMVIIEIDADIELSAIDCNTIDRAL